MGKAEKEVIFMYYQKETVEVMQELSTKDAGLSKEEVIKRLEKYGKNELLETKSKPAWLIFLEQFKDLLVIILICAALISAISGERESTIVILVVIIMNAILGTIQTLKAQKSLDALKQMSTPHSKVYRNGELVEVSSAELTIGDIIVLEAGDVVGADARILDSFSLQVNESALTGEVEAVTKYNTIIKDKVGLGDRKNMVFATTLVTYGRARAIVTNVGMDTEIGKIATLMNTTKERKTPLQRTLDDFSKVLSIVIIAICIVVFGLNLMRGSDVLDALMFAVALAVAAIPEALASIVTIVLAMGTSTMAKKNAIMKNINAVESLGCVSVICSDKTGTLTQNKMTAQQIYYRDTLCQATQLDDHHHLDHMLMLCFTLCNDASISEEGSRVGDPTELAFIDWMQQMQKSVRDIRGKYPRIDENPFDSVRKMMSTLHLVDDKKILFTKGACDELLKKSTHILLDEGIKPLNEELKQQILTQNMQFANSGLRVLGFAYKLQEPDCTSITLEDEQDLIFIGLVSLMDPPRNESKDAVTQCKKAGMIPVMITGDHKVTARAIAQQIGIYEDGFVCIEGSELDELSDEQLQAQLENIRVYARVAPEHKIRIVNAWQQRGKIVAMTGDGVNDAPALKQADIGIAMGITGTEVSKDAASMILTDDNFATIVRAVATGRNIYANIKNSIIYLLSGNLSGILCVFICSLLALPVPFLPVHLLFINLVTDSLPAIAIGMEQATGNVLNEKPRNPKEGILTSHIMKQLALQGSMIAIVTMIAFFIGLQVNPGTATTMAFSTLCLARLFHGFNCRSQYSLKHIGFFSNKASIGAFTIGFILLIMILLVPALHGLFAITELEISSIGMIVVFACIPTLLIQIGRIAQGK